MSITNKNNKRKVVKKRKLPTAYAFTKTAVPMDEVLLPEKFVKMNEMLAKTTFLQS
jgi:hypothetical protein